MRNRYMVAYDVSDERRLRRMHKTLLNYGDPLQYSVFSCDLSAAERILMIDAIGAVMNRAEDRVMIVDLGPVGGRAGRCMEWMGRDPGISERRCVIV